MNVRDLNLIYVLILFLSNKAFFDLVKGVTSNFFQVLVFKDSSQIHFIYHILLKNQKYFILKKFKAWRKYYVIQMTSLLWRWNEN